MDILELESRFEFYAQQNKDLNHIPDDKKNNAFVVCDIEGLQAALKSGVKFPCLFLQIPEFEKQGGVDGTIETLETSFWVVMPKNKYPRKSQVYQSAKNICDEIYNQIIADAEEFFPGGLVKTSEGHIGSVADQLYGWSVSFGFDQPYDGTTNPDKWR